MDVQPFEGMRVVDLTHVLAGPFCTYQLAVMGADVIKVESPTEPDVARPVGGIPALNRAGMGGSYLTQGSNKRAITLDLKTEKGRVLLMRLVEGADVLVENYRTGALGALGLGFEAMSRLNPRLIYCSMTGFGQHGPKAGHTAYDNVIQASSGLMSTTGEPGATRPVKVGPPVLDYFSGITAAFAVACALHQRDRTGRGQHVDMAMLDAAMMLMAWTVTDTLNGAGTPRLWGNGSDNAGYACYATADGLLMVGCESPSQHRRMWRLLGYPEYASVATFEEVLALRDEQTAILDALFITRTADAWAALFHEAGLPAERVRTLEEALEHEQFAERGLFHRHAHVPGAGDDIVVPVAAFSFAHGGPRVRTPPPRHGEHTEEVLAELGLAPAEVAALRSEGVI